MMKIGYLGPKGTFSEKALKTFLMSRPDLAASLEPQPFQSITQNICTLNDYLVLPWENSSEGSIVESLDLLIDHQDLSPGFTIIGEIILPIEQMLLVKPGTKPKQIQSILSHPQPLAQCGTYLHKQYPHAELHKVASTAFAADAVAKSAHHSLAAVGNEELGPLYGLEVLERNIQDSKHNSTRFVIASKSSPIIEASSQDKTTLVFSTQKDRPGSLVEILSEFSLRGINMTSILSRPAKTKLGDYVFIIDCEGHQKSALLKETFDEIRKKSSFFSILGSYPAWKGFSS